MYKEDLSIDDNGTIAIGWLDSNHVFAKKKADSSFLEKLREYVKHPVRQTKGFHGCDFCVSRYDARSSNEIAVISKDGKVYASPRMIIHYIEAHDYSPPQEFVDAVMDGITPGSDEWQDCYHKTILPHAKKILEKRTGLK